MSTTGITIEIDLGTILDEVETSTFVEALIDEKGFDEVLKEIGGIERIIDELGEEDILSYIDVEEAVAYYDFKQLLEALVSLGPNVSGRERPQVMEVFRKLQRHLTKENVAIIRKED